MEDIQQNADRKLTNEKRVLGMLTNQRRLLRRSLTNKRTAFIT